MILRQTDNYIKVCMNTWLVCEACIHSENEKLFPREGLILACQDCARSCLSVVSLFMNNPWTPQKDAFDCFLYCRECYNECLLHPEEDIEYCGEVCNKCAETLKALMVFQFN